jgi:peptidoglycan/LPS O-acetylase OafA/YrhL
VGAPESRRIDGLEGLRGLAALHVVLRHQAMMYGVNYHPAVRAMLAPFGQGLIAHHFFFVLTGFGLTYSLLRKPEPAAGPRLGPFLVTRWQRIAPLYYLALALYLVVPSIGTVHEDGPFWTGPTDFRQAAVHFLFLHGLWTDTIYTISPPLWSLSLIFQFYLVFPLFYVAATRVGYRWVLAGTVLFWLALRALLKYGVAEQTSLFSGFILCRLVVFVAGVGVAHWYLEFQQRAPERRSPFAAAVAPVAVALLGVAIVAQRGRGGWLTDLLYASGYSALIVAVILSAQRQGRLNRWLGSGPLIWLGSISFALYITHDLVLTRTIGAYTLLVERPSLATDGVLVVAGVGLSACFAWAVHALVEGNAVAGLRRSALLTGLGEWSARVIYRTWGSWGFKPEPTSTGRSALLSGLGQWSVRAIERARGSRPERQPVSVGHGAGEEQGIHHVEHAAEAGHDG